MTQSDRRRTPWGLIGAIGLVLTTEWGWPREEISNSTNASMSWRHGGRAAYRRAKGCDVLCFGDSQVQFQVQPRVLERRTGQRVYNLGLYAGPPPASYYQLRHALDSGARPSAVVVDFQPGTLELGPAGQLRLWPELLSTREAIDLARTARDAGLLAPIALSHVLPSYRDRYEIRANVASALRGESYQKFMTFWYLPLRRNWRVNAGSTVLPKSPKPLDALTPAEVAFVSRPWTPSPVGVKYMRKFLALAKSERIPVFWLLPPNHPLVQARRDELGLEAGFTDFVRRVQALYPDVHVVDSRRCGFPRESFADVCHLDARGAEALSVGVSDVLRRSRAGISAGSRWTELPPYREGPADVPLEDIDQSRIAMKIVP